VSTTDCGGGGSGPGRDFAAVSGTVGVVGNVGLVGSLRSAAPLSCCLCSTTLCPLRGSPVAHVRVVLPSVTRGGGTTGRLTAEAGRGFSPVAALQLQRLLLFLRPPRSPSISSSCKPIW
jgi:hypothetical protein